MKWPWSREDHSKKAEEWRACISVTEIQRPCLHIEEHQREDGSFVADMKRQVWSAITFKADIDPYDYAEKTFGRVTISVGPVPSQAESWYFYNAKIALLPGSDFRPGHFVMIYDSCSRATELEHEP